MPPTCRGDCVDTLIFLPIVDALLAVVRDKPRT
jgi:hypothetical protein